MLFQAWNPHVPPVLIASTENPAWTATFWFETTDFTPRTVEISTSSLTFGMFDTTTSINSTYLPLSSVQETTLKIQIIPAPSSALALLAGAGMLTVRRRRG
ncbi:MAG: PEP-CTERM sorting domain-containing protein [Phycisphaerales bacterium]